VLDYSRRDDLESLSLVLIFLSRGELPWQNLPNANDRRKMQEGIYTIKAATQTQYLVQVKTNNLTFLSSFYSEICRNSTYIFISNPTQGVPRVLGTILEYARGLEFTAAPDYPLLLALVRKALVNVGVCLSDPPTFDWTPCVPRSYYGSSYLSPYI
jgi:hypothetical protein